MIRSLIAAHVAQPSEPSTIIVTINGTTLIKIQNDDFI